MGEIADMMLEGILCEGCGCALDDDAPGHPRRCAGCREDEKPTKPGRREREKLKAQRGDALPTWKLESADDISIRYHCNHCLRHFATEDAARQHAQATHGAQP